MGPSQGWGIWSTGGDSIWCAQTAHLAQHHFEILRLYECFRAVCVWVLGFFLDLFTALRVFGLGFWGLIRLAAKGLEFLGC